MINKIRFPLFIILGFALLSVGIAGAQRLENSRFSVKSEKSGNASNVIQHTSNISGENSGGRNNRSGISVKAEDKSKNTVSNSGRRFSDDENEGDENGGDNDSIERGNSPAPTPTITPTPSNSPTPTPTPTPSANTFTMAQISLHNSASDCYTAISGSVYNLTSYIAQHPGGSGAIISLCGKDGTAAFNAQHAGQSNPAGQLASLKIGIVQ